MPDVDMFGHPVDPRHGCAGRPRHMPTAAQRTQVRALHADGRTQLEIARTIGITIPTLTLNYPDELNSKSQGRRKRALQEQSGDTQWNTRQSAPK